MNVNRVRQQGGKIIRGDYRHQAVYIPGEGEWALVVSDAVTDEALDALCDLALACRHVQPDEIAVLNL